MTSSFRSFFPAFGGDPKHFSGESIEPLIPQQSAAKFEDSVALKEQIQNDKREIASLR
jgi:hypothetical protein